STNHLDNGITHPRICERILRNLEVHKRHSHDRAC
ncbi:unnamed protein product, partial [Musa acuminata subsp. malaccensis]